MPVRPESKIVESVSRSQLTANSNCMTLVANASGLLWLNVLTVNTGSTISMGFDPFATPNISWLGYDIEVAITGELKRPACTTAEMDTEGEDSGLAPFCSSNMKEYIVRCSIVLLKVTARVPLTWYHADFDKNTASELESKLRAPDFVLDTVSPTMEIMDNGAMSYLVCSVTLMLFDSDANGKLWPISLIFINGTTVSSGFEPFTKPKRFWFVTVKLCALSGELNVPAAIVAEIDTGGEDWGTALFLS